MKALKISIILIFIVFVYNPSFTQNTGKIDKLIEEAVVKEKKMGDLIELATKNNESTVYAIQRLEIYYSDNRLRIRENSYNLLHRIARLSRQNAVRQNAVLILVNGLQDKKEGLTGQLFGYLEHYYQTDFTIETKDSIRSFFLQKIPHFNKLIKITGFLEMHDMNIYLREIVKPGSNYSKKEKWFARLALARMGDTYILEHILKTIRQNMVNDNIIYDVVPDLIYIKQPAAIEYLVEIIYSNERNCSTADPDSYEKILCAYRVMEYLAPILANYPYKPDITGDLNTSDYEGALQTVREWFSNKQGHYLIRREIY